MHPLIYFLHDDRGAGAVGAPQRVVVTLFNVSILLTHKYICALIKGRFQNSIYLFLKVDTYFGTNINGNVDT